MGKTNLNIELDCEKNEKEIVCKARIPKQCKADGDNIVCRAEVKDGRR